MPLRNQEIGKMDLFDVTEQEYEFRKKANSSLSHTLGSKDEEISFLPDLSKSIQKEARRNFSEREKFALIEEDGQASNADRLDIKGTHYESQSSAEIAMMILPLMGLSSKNASSETNKQDQEKGV